MGTKTFSNSPWSETAGVNYSLNFHSAWQLNPISSHSAINITTGTQYQDGQIAAPGAGPNVDEWTHVALVRSGNNNKLFVNGEVRIEYDENTVTPIPLADFIIGGLDLSQNSGRFNGQINDFRITESADYVTEFTPPTSLTSPTGAKLLLQASAPYSFTGSEWAGKEVHKAFNGNLENGVAVSSTVANTTEINITLPNLNVGDTVEVYADMNSQSPDILLNGVAYTGIPKTTGANYDWYSLNAIAGDNVLTIQEAHQETQMPLGLMQ